MFKKKDYLEYFGQILKMEKSMKLEGQRLLKLTDDKRIKTLMKNLIEDEERHAEIVRGIILIIKKYAK